MNKVTRISQKIRILTGDRRTGRGDMILNVL